MRTSLNKLYEVAGISKQAFHKYKKRKGEFEVMFSNLQIEVDLLRKAHPGCGVEKMYQTLQPNFIGRDQFIAYMMELGYRVKKPKNYIKTTIPAHYKYPNLIEGSIVNDVDQVWQSDITYILVGTRYYYLVFIIDVYSRKILGYQASDHLRAEANAKALNMAFRLRGKKRYKNLIHHSDRGSQYISHEYTSMLKNKEIHISMGNQAIENAYAERINGTIKNEFLKHQTIVNLKELRKSLIDAVKYYNTKRPHNSLKCRQTPEQFERNLLTLKCKNRPTMVIHTEGYKELREATNFYEFQSKADLGNHICPILTHKHSIT